MLAAIEDLLDAWPGTLLVVSHDRYLIERVTDQQVAILDGFQVPSGPCLELRRQGPTSRQPGSTSGVRRLGCHSTTGSPAVKWRRIRSTFTRSGAHGRRRRRVDGEGSAAMTGASEKLQAQICRAAREAHRTTSRTTSDWGARRRARRTGGAVADLETRWLGGIRTARGWPTLGSQTLQTMWS